MCPSSPTCLLCNCQEESLEHILFFCPHTKAVWFGAMGFYAKEVGFSSFSNWCQRIQNFFHSTDKRVLKLASFLCWQIWKARNRAIFNSAPPNPFLTFRKAQNGLDEVNSLALSQQISMPTPSMLHSQCWSPPQLGVYKINVDGSFDYKSFAAGIGCLVRNSEGRMLDGSSASFSSLSP
ncbi:hypothetical protein P3X46_011392 [Hevea brasiliensis]|uniref:Reverse transcriptase zinc-binding domain-containing protein n=1 Tax=Hevea brasiliensis TaxID=3981 RepID=A0ABQ9M6Z1_HEVBR|nr:hypothetical protein P3X46_011392 [Hevea brasiliensis]